MNPALDLRTVAELTQNQAADLINVTTRTWRNWETSGKMPESKAQAFCEAVKQHDLGLTHQPTVKTSANAQIQAAADVLRALGRRPLPEGLPYTPQDPFGQERLNHLRTQPANVSETEIDNDFEPTVDGEAVTEEAAAALLRQMRAGKLKLV
jgi:DNA-binding XRE family transcriptional regulator